MRSSRYVELVPVAADEGNLYVGPERGLGEGDRQVNDDVVPMALENLMGTYADETVKVARPTIAAGFALT